jgi:hypothetical protein
LPDPQLPQAGTTLDGGASLYIDSPGTTSGPLTVNSSENPEPNFSLELGESPDSTLAVSGAINLDESANLFFDIDDNGSTASTDFSRLTASGHVALNDATLYLNQGEDSQGGCVALTPGDSFPVISATGALSGDLTYFGTSNNLDTLTPGSTSSPLPVTLPDGGCPSGTSTATAVLTYSSNAITATIASVPQAGTAPAISGTPTVGQTLSVGSSGTWGGHPAPAYSYQWFACASSCVLISGATASTLALTGTDVGDQIKVQVTATNTLGSASAYSNEIGPVTAGPVTPTGPTIGQINSALSGITHPSGKKAITACLKSGSFKTTFHAPSAGSLTITWTTTVTTGTGKHKKHKKHKAVTIATGSAHPGAAGTVNVTLRLTGTGKTLLRKKSSGLSSTATEKFEPSGAKWTSVTKKFSL